MGRAEPLEGDPVSEGLFRANVTSQEERGSAVESLPQTRVLIP